MEITIGGHNAETTAHFFACCDTKAHYRSSYKPMQKKEMQLNGLSHDDSNHSMPASTTSNLGSEVKSLGMIYDLEAASTPSYRSRYM